MRLPGRLGRVSLAVCVLAVAGSLGGCRQDMHDQPYFEPMEGSSFFADGRSERPQVEGTVARGGMSLDRHLFEGKDNDGKFTKDYPFEITAEALDRGHERFQIFCAHCHDDLGYGDGIIVQRGMKRPPSYHEQRLRDMEAGYFFHVITNGIGAMYDHADRIKVEDRWKIVAWVQTLQRSQSGKLDDVDTGERAELEAERQRRTEDAR